MTINEELKKEIQNFNGSSKMSVVVRWHIHYACGHHEVRYATASEILMYKNLILTSNHIDTELRIIAVPVDCDEICSDCSEQEKIRAEYRPDETIQKLVFSHGLDAFSKAEGNYEKMLEHFHGVANHPEWEICASDENTHLGEVGVACGGEVSLAATTDVFSYVKNGYRRCDVREYSGYFVTTAADLHPAADGSRYIEVWVKPQTIKYVWIRKNYSFKDEAEKYFKGLGYEVKIVA